VVITVRRSGLAFSAERMAVASDSVPQELNTISLSWAAPSSDWTCIRACLIALPTCEPKLWIEEALPNCSVK